jgi:carbon storage regulator CsrA
MSTKARTTFKEIAMLVLSRRIEEALVIDGRIEVQVLRVKGNTVRLGIRAPQDVKILRGELAPFGKEFEIGELVIEIPAEIA